MVLSSSAAAERVFSLLSNSFTEQQMWSLIGGLHRTFYNASVQQTELTLFLMFDFYWNNCRIITFFFWNNNYMHLVE